MPNEPKETLETLGQLISSDQKRDAIHIAVEPVIAGEQLEPGSHVEFMPDGRVKHSYDNPVGIIDPYLRDTIYRGQRCWLFVYPKKITSLRHVWEHPGFPASELAMKPTEEPKQLAPSQVWMFNYAEQLGVGYQELLDRAKDHLATESYWSEGGRFEGEYLPDEFWMHYEDITGEKVPNRKRGTFFSCSC